MGGREGISSACSAPNEAENERRESFRFAIKRPAKTGTFSSSFLSKENTSFYLSLSPNLFFTRKIAAGADALPLLLLSERTEDAGWGLYKFGRPREGTIHNGGGPAQ